MTYHFIGIGGIGMSALARILLKKGCIVTGSDSKQSAMTDALEKEGAEVFIGHKEDNVNQGTIVYSSAIGEKNSEFVKAKKLGLPILHRSDLLDCLCAEKLPLFVTGTHGKTTTTALLATVLIESDCDPSFVVGGTVQALQTNGRKGEGTYFVAEADESDGSFLKTAPFGAIVTNCENDHLDYWGSADRLDQGFIDFFASVKSKKHLFWCKDDARLCSFTPPGFSYGFSKNADLQILQWKQEQNGVVFDLVFQGKKYEGIFLSLFGQHNVLNGAAVFGLSLSLGIPEEKIKNAFAHFGGVKRRLEKRHEAHGVICYDDYGHHPTEIQVTLKAIKARSLDRRLVVLFQPHRFTRTKDLWNDFIHSFGSADLVIVTDVYGSGENPIDGITGENLASQMKAVYVPHQELEEKVSLLLRPFDVFITLGAGDVTNMGIPILDRFAAKAPKYTVGVISGGVSPEHPVSLMSARNVIKNLDPVFYNVIEFFVSKEGFWNEGKEKVTPVVLKDLYACDVVIPVMHGPKGEDGMVQGFLDTLGIPYVGCDYFGSALCMNKAWTKQIASAHQIPIVPYVEMDIASYRQNLHQIEENLSYPVWVKAVHLGSSFGVTRVTKKEGLIPAIEHSFSLDDQIIVEQEIKGREIEFAVLGNNAIRIANPCAILSGGTFYDYEKKYGKNAYGVEIPANITDLQKQVGQELALKAYLACKCKGLARVDFFLDENGHFWLNEINPFPGFTESSGYPKMWEQTGLPQKDLMNELIILALSRCKVHR